MFERDAAVEHLNNVDKLTNLISEVEKNCTFLTEAGNGKSEQTKKELSAKSPPKQRKKNNGKVTMTETLQRLLNQKMEKGKQNI